MDNVKTLLEAREEYLEKLLNEKEEAVERAPDGSLRINRNKNRIQYYQRTDPKNFTGTYISKDKRDLAVLLAQKDYDKKIIEASKSELDVIKNFQQSYPVANVEQIYETLHEERKKLVNPIQEPTEEMIQKWESVVYSGKPFAEDYPEIYTDKEERVRSKSEMIIANQLYKERIPYRYEYPVFLQGVGWVFPDFYVLNVRKRKEIIFEHFGRMSEEAYAGKTIKKISSYIQSGYYPGENLIFTFETNAIPLNLKIVKQMIEHYLK